MWQTFSLYAYYSYCHVSAQHSALCFEKAANQSSTILLILKTTDCCCRPTAITMSVIGIHLPFASVFGRPFVKRFALCYQTVVCLSCLSVTLVFCGQMIGWIKMKLGMQVDLAPGHIVLDWDLAPHPPKGHSPQFSAHICCGQMAGWIKIPLGTEVGLGQGHIVSWGSSFSHQKGAQPANFLARVSCGQTVALVSYCWALVHASYYGRPM